MKKTLFTIFAFLLFSILAKAQFTSNPALNTQLSDLPGEQAIPKIAVCTDGSMYVSWFSSEDGNYNVRLQYLDGNGNAQWENNGLLISDEPQMSWLTDYSLTTDPDNYAIVTFQDIREVDNNPVAYRVSPSGDMAWGETGILLSNNANFEPNPVVCATTLGNAVFAWQSSGDENEIHMQKVSPTGDLLWGEGITLAESGVNYTFPFLQAADGDYAFLIWHKETGPFWAPNRGLYVQKLDADGSFMWAEDLEVYAPTPAGPVISLEMCGDNNGGIVFSWYGNDNGTHFNCWVQHMNNDGTLSMAANGVLVSSSQAQNHMYPAPAFLPETNEIVVFFSEQDLNQNQRGLYAQKFDMAGTRQWTEDGKTLILLSDNDYSLPAANGFSNKAICVYGAFEFGNVVDAKVQAVMLDADGNFVWEDEFIDMSIAQSAKLHRVLSPMADGQWVSAWGDERNGNRDIYVQNIKIDGSLGAGSPGYGRVLGFVRDAATNLSIDAATISASATDDDFVTESTPFGSHYSFNVPQGNYNLSCVAQGYETTELSNVLVEADMNTAVNFYLNPVDAITGFHSANTGQFIVYPNPVIDKLNILPASTDELQKVVVSNINGQVVYQLQMNGVGSLHLQTLDLSGLKPGLYFASIYSLTTRYSVKFTKK